MLVAAVLGATGCWTLDDTLGQCVASGRCVAEDGGTGGGVGGGAGGGSGGGAGGGAGGGRVLGANVIFVTSAGWVPGKLGGIEGADAVCMANAADAGFAGTFRALLATNLNPDGRRLDLARGWVRPDGRPVADRETQLFGYNSVWYPPVLDEHGERTTFSRVATGINPGSTAGNICGTWNLTTGQTWAGDVNDVSGWADTGLYPVPCSQPAPIYCLEVDQNRAVSVTRPSPARLAFLSSAAVKPSAAGVAGLDAVCQAEGADAGFGGGRFKAFVALPGATAASRFGASGGVWVRADGVALSATAGELLGADPTWYPLAALYLDAHRGVQYRAAIAGARTPASAGTSADTCAGWTDATAAGSTTGGLAGESRPGFFDTVTQPCNAPDLHVYCFEE